MSPQGASQAVPASDEAIQSTRLPLIAYVSDRATLSVLTDVLAPALGPAAQFHLGGITEAHAALLRLNTPLGALLVDISGAADPLSALENLASHVEPGVRVFVVGQTEDMEFYRQITRVLGANEYLCKPLTRDNVARVFLTAMTGGGGGVAVRHGRVVTVTGVRGGTGATTIAVNLATQLADRARHHVLLFDADLHGGTASLMLSTPSGGGLRAALENPGRVDVLFTERSSPAISDRLRLLAAEEQLDTSVNIPAGAAEHLTSLLCNRYNFVVIDLPRQTSPLNRELRDAAHVHMLVMDATLPSLRDALRHLALPPGPHQAARPIVVLNRLGMPGTLTRKQVVDGLSGQVDVVVPWLPKQVQEATTLGEPAVKRRGAFQTAVAEIADQILPRRSEPSRSWLGRLRKSGS